MKGRGLTRSTWGAENAIKTGNRIGGIVTDGSIFLSVHDFLPFVYSIDGFRAESKTT